MNLSPSAVNFYPIYLLTSLIQTPHTACGFLFIPVGVKVSHSIGVYKPDRELASNRISDYARLAPNTWWILEFIIGLSASQVPENLRKANKKSCRNTESEVKKIKKKTGETWEVYLKETLLDLNQKFTTVGHPSKGHETVRETRTSCRR